MPASKPVPPPADPPAPPPGPPPGDLTGRVDGLEAEQKRQGGLLEQILGRLPGKTPEGAPAAEGAPGKSIAEQVREGIAALEAERATAAETDANKKAREDYAARIKALEERAPAEVVATPVGAARAKLQRAVFGITEPGK
jgi:hypothetical protein